MRPTDGINIRIQMAGTVSQERAFIMVQQMAGIINHNQEP